jgi:hypothetical protein
MSTERALHTDFKLGEAKVRVNLCGLQMSEIARSITIGNAMKKHYSKSIVKLLVFFASLVIGVSQSDAAGAPVVGRNAAAKYFKKTGQDSGSDRYIASDTEEKEGDFKRYMMFGGSLFTSSEAYQWAGLTKEKDVAKAGVDMSYRLSQYNELLDYALRVSFNEYSANGNRASKLSILYSAMLPDAARNFRFISAVQSAGVYSLHRHLMNRRCLLITNCFWV